MLSEALSIKTFPIWIFFFMSIFTTEKKVLNTALKTDVFQSKNKYS